MRGNTSDTSLTAALRDALTEDIGNGDITSQHCIPAGTVARARFVAKSTGVISGIGVAADVLHCVSPEILTTILVQDSHMVTPGTVIAHANGPADKMLTGERTALNFIQRMSGIATLTRSYVDAVKGTKAIILDTRKTAPGLRAFDKLAVSHGGGSNHRFGLFDMAMIKNNHIAACGSITKAVMALRKHAHVPIEVEVRTFIELEEALSLGVDRIMLDHFSVASIQAAVELTAGRTPLEASGNVNLTTVRDIASTGIDYISVGALTHSVIALDISFTFDLEN